MFFINPAGLGNSISKTLDFNEIQDELGVSADAKKKDFKNKGDWKKFKKARKASKKSWKSTEGAADDFNHTQESIDNFATVDPAGL